MLPAYAGMIRKPMATDAIDARAPRVCGDDPARGWDLDPEATCSPRMRG